MVSFSQLARRSDGEGPLGLDNKAVDLWLDHPGRGVDTRRGGSGFPILLPNGSY